LERLGPPTVALAFVSLLAFLGPTRPSADNDAWWHLRTGELILDRGSIPDTDPFSWTAAEQPWVAHEWGAQVILAAVERAAGPAALLLLAGALVGGAVLLLQVTLLRLGSDPWARAVASLVAVFLSTLIWTLRPHLFSLLFFALFLMLLTAERRQPGRATYWLIPATVVWANLHGAFVLGPLLVGIFLLVALLERRPGAKRLLLIGGACLVAGCLTPHGPALYLYPLHVAAISDQVTEWAPPDLREPHGLVFGLAAIGSLALLALRRPSVDAAHLATAVVFVLLGLAALKNVAFAGPALAPVIARALDGTIPTRSRPGRRAGLMLAGLIAAAAAAGTALVVTNLAGKTDGELLGEKKFPVAAVQVLKEQPPGRLANPYDWGGYLIYRARDFPVSMDGRNDMYGTALFERQLLLERLRPGWDDFLDSSDVRYVLWQRTSPLAEALRLHDDWELIHEDRLAVLFERSQ
jgi:hypothetical protein